VVRRFLPSPKTGTEPQPWNPGTLTAVGLQSWVNSSMFQLYIYIGFDIRVLTVIYLSHTILQVFLRSKVG